MDNLSFVEKRIFPRFQISIPLNCLDLNSNIAINTQTCDISAEGLCTIIDKEISPGASLDICLNMPDNGEQICKRGRIIWSKRINSDYRVGIKLEAPKLNTIMLVLRIINYRIKYPFKTSP
jgi:hypothetical protein